METVLIVIIVGIMNLFCLIKGVQIGQKISKEEEVKLPEINPIKVIAQKKVDKDREKELDKFNTIMKNIDSYDGTGSHQEEV